jgi:hypothetical protein
VPDADLFNVQRLSKSDSSSTHSKDSKDNAPVSPARLSLVSVASHAEIVTLPNSVVLVYSALSDSVPAAFAHFVRRLHIRPQTIVFINVSCVTVPRVRDDIAFTRVGDYQGAWRAQVLAAAGRLGASAR